MLVIVGWISFGSFAREVVQWETSCWSFLVSLCYTESEKFAVSFFYL